MKFFCIFYKFYKIQGFIVFKFIEIIVNKIKITKNMNKMVYSIFLFIKTIEIILVLMYNMI